jgi:hypothetical protein
MRRLCAVSSPGGACIDYERSNDDETVCAKMVTVYGCSLPGWDCSDEGVCLCLTWAGL